MHDNDLAAVVIDNGSSFMKVTTKKLTTNFFLSTVFYFHVCVRLVLEGMMPLESSFPPLSVDQEQVVLWLVGKIAMWGMKPCRSEGY